MADIEDMPIEILEQIFQLIPSEDLLHSVGNVSQKWQSLASTKPVWKNKVFAPHPTMNNSEILESFEVLQNITQVCIHDSNDFEELLQLIMLQDTFPQIRSFVTDRKNGPALFMLHHLIKNNPNIETLDVCAPGTLFHLDYAKFLLNEKYKNENLVLYTGNTGLSVQKQDFENFRALVHPKSMERYPDEEAIFSLQEQMHNIEYLAIGSRVVNELMNLVYECDKLKILYLHANENCSPDVVYFKRLTSLRNLYSLHLHLSKKTVIMAGPFTSYHFSSLLKIEIYSHGAFASEEARKLWAVVPNLRHLRLKAELLNDEALRGIHHCKFLKHIDLSDNNPGFYNKCLTYIALGCHNLEFLDLSDSPKAICYDLAILRPCSNLGSLRLRNQAVTEQHFIAIPKLFPRLAELHIGSATYVTETMIKQLKTKMPTLKIVTSTALYIKSDAIIHLFDGERSVLQRFHH